MASGDLLDLSQDMSMEEEEEDTVSEAEHMAGPTVAPTLDTADFFRQLREALPLQQHQPSLASSCHSFGLRGLLPGLVWQSASST